MTTYRRNIEAGQAVRGDRIVVRNGQGEDRLFTVRGASYAAAATADRLGLECEAVAGGHVGLRFYDKDETITVERDLPEGSIVTVHGDRQLASIPSLESAQVDEDEPYDVFDVSEAVPVLVGYVERLGWGFLPRDIDGEPGDLSLSLRAATEQLAGL